VEQPPSSFGGFELDPEEDDGSAAPPDDEDDEDEEVVVPASTAEATHVSAVDVVYLLSDPSVPQGWGRHLPA
jgi:hypothetical protein